MKENNLIKVLIPLVAVVVVFESIVLVTSLDKGTKSTVSSNQATNSAQTLVSEVAPIELVFATDTQEMKIGKAYTVSLNMTGKEDKKLDGIDLYVKFGPNLVNITGLNFPNKTLGQPVFSKVSTLKNVVVASFLVSDKQGFAINKDELNNLMEFKVTPKKIGKIDFEVSTGSDSKESVTMFVENSTGKVLNFSSNKLEITAIK